MSDSIIKDGLTICTVSYKHKSLIEENIQFIQKMNPCIAVSWIIVENTPEGVAGRMNIGKKDNVEVLVGSLNNFKGIATASYHHASGLNKALPLVRTRYVLVLDPDFFIIRPNWINDVVDYMENRNLSFFGAPYNPKRYMKYRYFPCIHCVFIDLKQVDSKKLDFNPQYDQVHLLDNHTKAQIESSRFGGELFYRFIQPIKHNLRLFIKRKAVIGSSRDTGYELFLIFAKHFKSECIQPVFKIGFSDVCPKYLMSWLNRLIEFFLPDEMCYFPKKKDYYSSVSFKDLGYLDMFNKGWDEFVWQGKPFGFHLQGAKKDGSTTDHSQEMYFLRDVLGQSLVKAKNRTLFITMFEGVESKNILRTGIVNQILEKNQFVRIVLFMKNKERADYYAKEFSDPRIIYEVVEPYEIRGINRFFGLRKFLFLQTETTDLRAKMIAEDRGQLYCHYSLLIHRFLARPVFIRIFRCLDFWLVKDYHFDSFFVKYQPSLILLANLLEDLETKFLRAAKKHHVSSIGLINSWDRVTARCILRLLPDKIIVFNDVIKQEMLHHDLVSEKNVFVSGMPQYDIYFSPVSDSDSKQEFFKRLGLNLGDELILYSPIGGMFSDSDWEMIDLLYALNDQKKFGENVKILVSFPPNDFIKVEELRKRPYLIYQYLGKRFSTTRSTDWDITVEEMHNLKNVLHYMSLIVCYSSSISIDAAIFDKPVININFEIKDNQKLSKSPTLFYQMTHYKKALDTKGIHLVNSKEELIKWTKKYLNDPGIDRENRLGLVRKQCQFTDGKSAKRIADFLIGNFE